MHSKTHVLHIDVAIKDETVLKTVQKIRLNRFFKKNSKQQKKGV